MIAGFLPAQPDRYAMCVRFSDDVPDHPFHSRVARIELFSKQFGIAVDPQNQLGQIVAADRKTVKALREFGRKHDIARHLAHDQHFKPALAAFKPVRRHQFQHPVRLADGPAKRHHDADIGEAHVLAQAADSLAFERKGFAKQRRNITRCPPKTEHRILFMRLEYASTDQISTFIALEVAEADDHAVWKLHCGDPRKSARKSVDEIFSGAVETADRLPDNNPFPWIGHAVRFQQGHRMDLHPVGDDEFHPGKSYPVSGEFPPAIGRARIGKIQHHLCFALRQGRQVDPLLADFGWASVHKAAIAAGAIDGDNRSITKFRGSIAAADNRRDTKLAADDRRMRCPSAMIGNDCGCAFHDRPPVRIGDAGDKHRTIDEAVALLRT